MEIDVDEFARDLTRDLNYIVSDVFRIPDAVFKEHGTSGFNVAMYELMVGTHPELVDMTRLEKAKVSFRALCDSAPSIPSSAIQSISMAYASVSLSIDERANDPGNASAMKTLFSASTMMGMAMGIASADPSTGEAQRTAMLAVASGNRAESEARTALARIAAQARHAKDPKQTDKASVRECWGAWQKQPTRYRGKSAFARDMLDKYPSLRSQQVIEGWCRDWEQQT